MAERHNLCPNPALSVDVTGWGGGGTPTRTAVTGFGRPWAAHYTSGTFQIPAATPSASVTPGQVYTGSLYLRSNVFNQANRTLFLEWLNASGSPTGSPASASFSLTSGVVARASVTGTAPAGAAAARLVVDGINTSLSDLDATVVLIEQGADLLDYFDGDSPGASWDGTPGLSTSTMADQEEVSGTLVGILPALTADVQASVAVEAALTAGLPALGTTLEGDVTAQAVLDADLPAFSADLAGQASVTAEFDGRLPPLTGSAQAAAAVRGSITALLTALTGAFGGAVEAVGGPLDGMLPGLTATGEGEIEAEGSLAASLPALTGSLGGSVEAAGVLDAALPPLSGAVSGHVFFPQGVLAGSLPSMQGAFAGTSDAVELDIEGVVGAPQTRWPVGPPETRFVVGAPYV